MTLAELRGGVYARLAPREKILAPAVDLEIHNAIDDIRAEARNCHSEALDRIAMLDALPGVDIYDYPEEAEEIRDVFYMLYGTTPMPMASIGFREQVIADWVGFGGTCRPFAYTTLPERKIRVLDKSASYAANAFLVRFFPGPSLMVKATDEPNLPRPVHENIIVGAVMRLAGYSDIALSHPASFNIYRLEMKDRLLKYLQPDATDAANHIQDEDPYYPGGA